MGWLEQAATEMTHTQVIGWAAAIATAVATVVTAALTFWFRLIDRPRPRWEIIPQHQLWEISDIEGIRHANHDFLVSNVGTGPARLVSFIGIYCNIVQNPDEGIWDTSYIPLAEPGHTVSLRAKAIPGMWNHVRLLVTWTEPSHWFFGLKYKHQTFVFCRYFDRPVLKLAETDMYGRSVYSDLKQLNPEVQDEIRELENGLEQTKTVVLASQNWFQRRRLWKKLRRAGWGWSRMLPDAGPEQSE